MWYLSFRRWNQRKRTSATIRHKFIGAMVSKMATYFPPKTMSCPNVGNITHTEKYTLHRQELEHVFEQKKILSYPQNFRPRKRPSRQHNYQLVWKAPKDGVSGLQENFFYFRMIKTWNMLPKEIVHANHWPVASHLHFILLILAYSKTKSGPLARTTARWFKCAWNLGHWASIQVRLLTELRLKSTNSCARFQVH